MKEDKTINPEPGRIVPEQIRILIIDDEEMIRALLQDILRQAGYQCDTSSSALEGLDKLKSRSYALALVDLKMPGMDGIELLKKLRKLNTESYFLATIVITGVTALDMAVQAMQLGASDYLTKPLTEKPVLLSVAKALDRRRLILENIDYQRHLEDQVRKQSEKIQNSLLKTIETLARSLEAKDSFSREHSRRVTEYAIKIARKLSLSPQELENIRVAALLHDIGKLGISDRILEKINPLEEEEVEHIHRHPLIAENILGPIDDLKEIILLIKHHHERWDGGGYPDGLKGEEIPLGSRIIAVADAYDAMASRRPYRDSIPQELVLKELKEKAGTQFDPDIVASFIKLITD